MDVVSSWKSNQEWAKRKGHSSEETGTGKLANYSEEHLRRSSSRPSNRNRTENLPFVHGALPTPPPPPACSEMDLRSALSWTQETSTSSSFSPLAAPPYRQALRQPLSSQLGCSPITPEPESWGSWGDRAPTREERAAPCSQTSEGSPTSSSAVSIQTGSPNWNGAQWLHDPPQTTAKEQSEPGWNAAIKRNIFESALRKGMNRERIKQASQSERGKHGIEKDGSDESVHIAAPEMQT